MLIFSVVSSGSWLVNCGQVCSVFLRVVLFGRFSYFWWILFVIGLQISLMCIVYGFGMLDEVVYEGVGDVVEYRVYYGFQCCVGEGIVQFEFDFVGLWFFFVYGDFVWFEQWFEGLYVVEL